MPTVSTTQANAIVEHERICRDDFAYAAANLFYIRPKEEALTRLRLNWPQQLVYSRYLKPAWDAREPLALTVLKTRRCGMTTLFMAWMYHKLRFYAGQNCYVIANDDPTLSEIFLMASRFHENLPPDLVPPVDKNNTEQLSYAPPWDSSLRARVAKYGEVGRGTTLHHVLLDELAFYPDPAKILLGVLDAVPRTSASSLIMSSTANGADTWFSAVWEEFSSGEHDGQGWGGRNWQCVFLPWFQNPYNRMPVGKLWSLDPEEKELKGAFALSMEQLAWRRGTLREYERLFPGMGKRKFQQENPSTPAEAFILSGDCIWSEAMLNYLKSQQRPPSLGFTLHQTGTWKHTLLPHKEPELAPVKVWEAPQRGYKYALGVDVGLGVGGDDSAVVVMRHPGFRTVAHYADNVTAPIQFAYMVGAIADWYGRGSGDLPIVNVELNNAGIQINTEISTMQGVYQLQPYAWEYWDRQSNAQQSTKTGWTTTQQTKHLMMGVANSLIIARQVFMPCAEIRRDMARTIEIKPGLYRTTGADLCMAWLLALVACYRKLALYDWPTLGDPRKLASFPDDPGRPDDPVDEPYTEYGDRTRHDTGWLKIMRGRREGMTGLEMADGL